MAQTPQQRRANAKFAKTEESKMGSSRPQKADRETRQKTQLANKFKNSPISKWWVYVLVFVLIGGLFLEILRLFF